MAIQDILEDLKEERTRVDAPQRERKNGHRRMSAATRQKMSKNMKKRWALLRATKKAA